MNSSNQFNQITVVHPFDGGGGNGEGKEDYLDFEEYIHEQESQDSQVGCGLYEDEDEEQEPVDYAETECENEEEDQDKWNSIDNTDQIHSSDYEGDEEEEERHPYIDWMLDVGLDPWAQSDWALAEEFFAMQNRQEEEDVDEEGEGEGEGEHEDDEEEKEDNQSQQLEITKSIQTNQLDQIENQKKGKEKMPPSEFHTIQTQEGSDVKMGEVNN